MKAAQRRQQWGATAQLATTTGTALRVDLWTRLLLVATQVDLPARPKLRTAPFRPERPSGLTGLVPGVRCPADWRRPDEYWACRRDAGHAGPHRLCRVESSRR